jgi:hypothetical protein
MVGSPSGEGNRVFAGKQKEWCLLMRPGDWIVGQILAAAQAQARAYQALHGQMTSIRRLAVFQFVRDQQDLSRDFSGRKQLAGTQIRVQATARAAQWIEIGFSHAVSHWIAFI